MAPTLDHYAERFETIRFERHDGILQMTLHSGGDSLRWGAAPVAELQEAFAMVGADPDNRIVILTGAGAEFNGPKGSPDTFPNTTAKGWEFAHYNTRRLLMNLLDIEAPMITAMNGPAWRHCETPLLSDIVLASTTTVLQDSGHFINGLVPGDGMHLVMTLLMGYNRARYFMLTGQEIDARKALEIGLVNEVLPPEQVLPRAWELARKMNEQSALVLRYTRVAFVHQLRQLLLSGQGYGVLLEGMAAIDDSASRGGYQLGGRI